MNPSSTRLIAPRSSTPAAVAPPFVPLLARPAPAANGNGHAKREAPERVAIVGELYKKHAASLLRVAMKRVDDLDDAKDATQEAVLVLMTSPNRKPTRGALFAILRTVCRDRAMTTATEVEYVDDTFDDEGDATWRERTAMGDERYGRRR